MGEESREAEWDGKTYLGWGRIGLKQKIQGDFPWGCPQSFTEEIFHEAKHPFLGIPHDELDTPIS